MHDRIFFREIPGLDGVALVARPWSYGEDETPCEKLTIGFYDPDQHHRLGVINYVDNGRFVVPGHLSQADLDEAVAHMGVKCDKRFGKPVPVPFLRQALIDAVRSYEVFLVMNA